MAFHAVCMPTRGTRSNRPTRASRRVAGEERRETCCDAEGAGFGGPRRRRRLAWRGRRDEVPRYGPRAGELFGLRHRPGLSGGFLVLRILRSSEVAPHILACECIWRRTTRRGGGRGAPFAHAHSTVRAVTAVRDSSIAMGDRREAREDPRIKTGCIVPAQGTSEGSSIPRLVHTMASRIAMILIMTTWPIM